MAQINAVLSARCTLCSDPDDGNMIGCSKCNTIYHYNCCHIDEDSDIRLWICEFCCTSDQQSTLHNLNKTQDQQQVSDQNTELQSQIHGSQNEHYDEPTIHQNVSNTNRNCLSTVVRPIINAKTQLKLQMLEEELHLKQEFLRRKFELLQSQEVEEDSHTLDLTQMQNVRAARNNSLSSSINASQVVYNDHQHANANRLNSSECRPHLPCGQNDCVNTPLNQPQCQNDPNSNFSNVNNSRSDVNLSTTQLVARQCFSRDLPPFNGDPREWPIFISAFERSTSVAGYSNEENLIRLQKCLQGKARDAVRNCLMLPEMVPDIIRTLKMYFGRPECVLKTLIEEVRRMTLQKGKLESLIEFAFAVKNICATIRASQLDDYLFNPTILQELVEKLSSDTILQWALHSKNIPRPTLLDFSDWLYTIAEATCKVTVPVFEISGDKKSSRREGRLNAHANSSTQKYQPHCVICEEPHKVVQCIKFQELSSPERWNIVRSKNLCRMCLGQHRRKCWFQKPCGINDCTVQHNPLLHNAEQPIGSTVSTLNNHKAPNEGESYFRIVPVTLYSDTKSITIYALMDDGSTLTLLEEKVANYLGVRGIIDPLCIRWTGDVSRFEDKSRRLDLKISSAKTDSQILPIKNVYTINNLSLGAETLVVEDIKRKYSYLKDIPLEGYTNIVPSMIIGVNNPKLISSLKIREGGWQQPVASKTRLGWTLFGGSQKNSSKLNFHKCSCSHDGELNALIKHYFIDENVGASPLATIPMSNDDQRALDILKATCKFKEGRYEVGLLWKQDHIALPDSFQTAIKRLECLKRKASRDPTLFELLQQQIHNLEEKKYAQRLPHNVVEEQCGKIWYLPTFIVKNPQKPNKIRLVWDAAAKTGNFCLNDYLLKGPDLLIPLVNVLFKFRMGAIAICGDIAEMFHRIKVRKEDACAQRFLWWNNENSFMIYQLNVLTFGASCSPCISHYVRNMNAEKFSQHYPKVADAITKQHYVDDFIDSTNTVDEAIELALGVRDVHAQGGFHMRNWSSNSSEVLSALGETKVFESKTFDSNQSLTQYEKILGLYWDSQRDIFKINLKFVRLRRPILTEEIVPTKREVLQVLMSVFDPMGYVACFMSYLKVVLQEIWRCGIDWDQQINEPLYQMWKKWLKFIPTITEVSIPRCYSLAIQKQRCNVQLHTFVDASEQAYAAVSYFRIEFDGSVDIRLVASKSKVAPLRPLSVPRLELQAAVIGVRLMSVIKGHNIKFQRTVMWSDSKTVLNWLTGDPRKYKQFVMFRVAEILKFTEVRDWKWVPSALNVADLATKYKPSSDIYKEWFNGPTWLMKNPSEWPECSINVQMDMSEIRPRYLNLHTRRSLIIPINFEYFSSWSRLYRAIGNWILLIECLHHKIKNQEPIPLNASHLNKGKHFIYKMVQLSSFPDEYASLQANKSKVKGAFDKLNVYIDSYGIVRVKNRAQYAPDVCGTQRDLIILPAHHHVTKLIIMNYHRAYHHLNHETVLNEIRQYYFIVRLRVAFKVVRRSCQQCKIDMAKPVLPQMAPLPSARLAGFQRPFTFVGIDYFGPILVTSGRKSLKRWGVLFTCLTIRAVHIEIAHSLSTDSFLMCLRNFITRRGFPAEIYSDNGTNFRGADRFLKEQLRNIKFEDIQTNLAYKGISWKFNPPAAPHMGGAWERLIRSVKSILYKISPNQKFSDESLRSALMEIELIVNSRPLTYVTLENEDQEAITPNHFLLGSSNGKKPFCKVENIDHKMCLKQSEIFANMFWRRWVKEMLPTLTRRCKWFEKVKPISEGDIVLVVDENAERNSWLKGKVIEVTKAKDGQVRRAKIKSKNGIMERPAAKLAVIDVNNGME